MKGSPQDIDGAISSKFKKRHGFLPYIEEISFPAYKALREGLKIEFSWPITALVGPNGTNKSSILHALYGAPQGNSVSRFWFSTEVDDISSGIRRGELHNFIYKFRFDSGSILAECRKSRVTKNYRSSKLPAPLRGKRDPDYWEPTKRIEGMSEIPLKGYSERLSRSRDRWNQIEKSVLYLDFRSELSSFDKFIYHDTYGRWTEDDSMKKYRAILRSRDLAKVLDGDDRTSARMKVVEPVRELSTDLVRVVAGILSKDISRIDILKHSILGPTGYTVRFFMMGSDSKYSEAHAGSGEFAVVRLVDALNSVQPSSLVLLDEPEVSLHPGAQVRLLQYIKAMVLKKGIQVVISTHSPTIVERLPKQAIKVLDYDRSVDRVVLMAQEASVTEAFARLGYATVNGSDRCLVVEDELVAEMVRHVLRLKHPDWLDKLSVSVLPGGAGSIVQYAIPTFARAASGGTAVLLDGDQHPSSRAGRTDSSVDSMDLASARDYWLTEFHECIPDVYRNSDGSGQLEMLRDTVRWASKHLGFLPYPGLTPEHSLAYALGEVGTDRDASIVDWKAYWREKARMHFRLTANEECSGTRIQEYQMDRFRELEEDSELVSGIVAEIERIFDW